MPSWFGKNPSSRSRRRTNRRDFYGSRPEDKDHSRNRRDFYGSQPQDIDYSRYRRDFYGHDLGDKRWENASRPYNRPRRQTVGPGAPPTRASEKRRKSRDERRKRRDQRRKQKRSSVSQKLPTNRRNPGWMVDGKDQFNNRFSGAGRGLAGGRRPGYYVDGKDQFNNRFSGGGMPADRWMIDGTRQWPRPSGGGRRPGYYVDGGTRRRPTTVGGGIITNQRPGSGSRRWRAPRAGEASPWGMEQYRRSQQGNRRPPQRRGSGGWQVPDHLQGDLSHLPAHLRRYVEQQRARGNNAGSRRGRGGFRKPDAQMISDAWRRQREFTPPGQQPAPPGMAWQRSGWTGKWVLLPIGART